MLWISSWISTVLPTPAPPKRPILPPRTYGAIRSMTLMPVSKISTFGRQGRRSREGRGGSTSARASAGGARLLIHRLAEDVPDPAERHVADGHRDRAARVERRRCRGRCRRSHPSLPRARGRRRGAAAPPRSGRVPSGRGMRKRGVDLRQEAIGEDGVDDDALDLEQLSCSLCRTFGCSRRHSQSSSTGDGLSSGPAACAKESRRPPGQAQISGTRPRGLVPTALCAPQPCRHTFGVIEASDELGYRAREHPLTRTLCGRNRRGRRTPRSGTAGRSSRAG